MGYGLYPEKVFVQKKLRYGLSNLIQSFKQSQIFCMNVCNQLL
jgi:hypothetical protein